MKRSTRLLLFVLTAWPAASALADAPASTDRDVPFDAQARRGLARQNARLDAHGQTLDCSGVALTDLLRKAGAMPNTPLRGEQLARVVDVQARDGYRVVFSLGELEAGLGHTRVLLADRCNGQALDEHDGPLRLLVPGDGRPARSVRQVERITVHAP